MSTELLRRIQSLSLKINNFHMVAANDADKNAALIAADGLDSLARSIDRKDPVFGIEPWHKIQDKVPLRAPGEMLLRLKDGAGNPVAPYPLIMAFYNNGMTADLDTVLVLAALNQFMQGGEEQVSVNVSGKSLRDAEFIKTILPVIEGLGLPKDRKIIFEIHESTTDQPMSRRVLEICRKLGIAFAIDDVGLSMNDIIRLADFEQMADFVKLDRKSVRARPGEKGSLDHVMALINATLPFATVVAEGVKSAEHAAELRKHHPTIQYVQGLYLPDRETFSAQYAEMRNKTET